MERQKRQGEQERMRRVENDGERDKKRDSEGREGNRGTDRESWKLRWRKRGSAVGSRVHVSQGKGKCLIGGKPRISRQLWRIYKNTSKRSCGKCMFVWLYICVCLKCYHISCHLMISLEEKHVKLTNNGDAIRFYREWVGGADFVL